MTASLAVSAIALSVGLVAACTSSGGNGTTHSPGPSGSSGPSTSCTKASAKTAKETLITAAGFAPSCVKIKLKAKFFFVDNEKKHHTATTKPGSPTHFDANLRTKGSTYTQTFNKPGTYVVVDKTSKNSMTLYVG